MEVFVMVSGSVADATRALYTLAIARPAHHIQTKRTQTAHARYASLNDPMPKFNAVSRRCLHMAALVYIGKSICADVMSFKHVD